MRKYLFIYVSFYTFLLNISFEGVADWFSLVEGYSYNFVDLESKIFLGALSALPVIFLPIAGSTASGTILWLVYYCHIIPTIVIFPYIVSSGYLFGFFWPLAISVTYIAICKLNEITEISLRGFRLSTNTSLLINLLVGIISIFILIFNFGFKLELPSIFDVYDLRSEYDFQLSVGTYGSFVAYLVPAIGFSISPFLLLLSINLFKSHKSYSFLYLFCALFSVYVIFGAGGYKAIAFAPIIVMCIYLLSTRTTSMNLALCISLPLFFMSGYLLTSALDFEALFYHWIRRIFLVPGMNSSYMYQFIVENNLSSLENAPLRISMNYYGSVGSANAGLYGDALARNIYFGVPLSLSVFFLILKSSDALAKISGAPFAIALFSLTGYVLSNSRVSTVFLTYGFAISFVLILLNVSIFNSINPKASSR